MLKRIVSVLIVALLAAVAAVAQERAVVGFSVAHLRAAADYESGLETEELMGREVEILDTDRQWVKVATDQPYIAWVNELALVRMSGEELEAYHNARKYICTAVYSTVYAEPSYKSGVLSDLVMGDVLRMTVSNGRPVERRAFAEVMLPSGAVGYVAKADLMDFKKWKESVASDAGAMISLARRFVGVPYLWGGMSPKGFDCSGFTRFCFMMNGVMIPRNASQQALLGVEVPLAEVPPGGDPLGRYAALKPGDLLFFGRSARVTHVAIYLGGGKIIQSSQIVRINSLIEGEPDFYYTQNVLLKVRRLL